MPGHLELTPAWQDIRSELRRTVGESTYDIWLAPLQIKNWDGTVLVLQGKPGTDSWVADRFGRVLERCARQRLGREVKVAFAGDPATAAREAIAQAAHLHPDHEDERFNPRYTFDQFIIGDGNRMAHAAALAVAEAPGQAINPLFLHAPPGLGKTHLLHAIGNYITAFDPHTTVRYTTVEAFTNGFVAALRGQALERFKHLYRDVDVLLIDDVQFLASKAKTEEEFFHTFNTLHDSGRQLVLTCDRLPSQLTGIEQRLRQRFEAGLVEHLSPPNKATRIAILRKRAALDRLEVSDPVVFDLIADRITDNVRSLEGALIRVVANHSLTGRPIDAELTEAVLDQIQPRISAATKVSPVSGPLTTEAIQRTVADVFNISTEQLTSTSRLAAITWPRQLAIHLSRELTASPLHKIGEAFGGRNHATVLHACKRVQERITTSPEDAAELASLRAKLTSGGTDRTC
ncbi:MAG TPA: chromosomal replication initiator protein DnaA [Solirubrobacteraceae bacterium]|nr:chromosomal replication initiator protein DnaA [Solirubrobacteraceae bacterium]